MWTWPAFYGWTILLIICINYSLPSDLLTFFFGVVDDDAVFGVVDDDAVFGAVDDDADFGVVDDDADFEVVDDGVDWELVVLGDGLLIWKHILFMICSMWYYAILSVQYNLTIFWAKYDTNIFNKPCGTSPTVVLRMVTWCHYWTADFNRIEMHWSVKFIP